MRRAWGAARLSGLLFTSACSTMILLAGAIPVILEGYSSACSRKPSWPSGSPSARAIWATSLVAAPANAPAGWAALLAGEQDNPGMGLALLGADGSALARQGEVASLSGKAGQLQPLADGLAIWLPGGDMPAMARWKQGRYQIGVPVCEGGVARLVIEQSAAPLVRTLERTGLKLFAYLAVLLLLGIVLARVLRTEWLAPPDRRARSRQSPADRADRQRAQPVLPAEPGDRVRQPGQ